MRFVMVPYLNTRSHKSVGIAILLVILFGPIGLFYASVWGGFVMTLVPMFVFLAAWIGAYGGHVSLFTWSIGILIILAVSCWLINLVWAIAGVLDYNRSVDREMQEKRDAWLALRQREQSPVVIHVHHPSAEMHPAPATPSLQQWLTSNPGRNVNDYYSRYRPRVGSGAS